MRRYLGLRLAQGALTLLSVTAVSFVLTRLSGSPVDVLLPIDATLDDRRALAQPLGLDQPLITQSLNYLAQLAHGDFGTSLYQRGQPALSVVIDRFPATAQLAGTSLLMALTIAIPLAVLSASRKGTWIDHLAELLFLIGQSAPVFWLGVVLVLIFGVELNLLPVAGNRSP